MIKKLNVFLFVIVAAMLGVKFVVDRLPSGGGTCAPSGRALVLNAGFAPRIVYEEMGLYAMENPMTMRNGCVLDTLKAVFPRGRLDLQKLDVPRACDILKNDPNAVCAAYGNHPQLSAFPHAPTPLAEADIVLYTLRTLEWNYTGPESIANIRLGFTEGYLDCPRLVRLYSESQKTSNPVRLFRSSDRYYHDPLSAVLDGEVDAVAMIRPSYSAETIGVTSETLFKFNVSDPVDRIQLLLIVSNADPEYAKRLIEAYENGLKEIEASGRLRRIREYYRISNER